MRLPLIALASLGLAGCWEGRSLYGDSDAVPAIPSGVYRATAPDEPTRVYRVSTLPSGLTSLDASDDEETFGIAPLDPDRGTFVVWQQVDDGPQDQANQIYALAVRRGNGAFDVYFVACADDQAEIARKSGAIVGRGISPICRFPTRASLERAMRSIQPNEQLALKLVRIRG